MKAVICREFGPRSELKLEGVGSPAPGPGKVLFDVEVCGINFFTLGKAVLAVGAGDGERQQRAAA